VDKLRNKNVPRFKLARGHNTWLASIIDSFVSLVRSLESVCDFSKEFLKA
jgi:hypothetical protein